jgi:hypothetical protein
VSFLALNDLWKIARLASESQFEGNVQNIAVNQWQFSAQSPPGAYSLGKIRASARPIRFSGEANPNPARISDG